MHPSSMEAMEYFRDEYLFQEKSPVSILEIGACVYGKKGKCYRSLFEKDYFYTGMDIVSGENVDIVGYENISGKYDVIISGQVMEHVRRPWEWLKYLVPFFSKYICIIAPHTWKEHKYPLDTYRYFPDGMRDLFEYAGIKELKIFKNENDTVGIGAK